MALHGVSQLRQQGRQLVKTAVNVADDVKWAMLRALVVIQRLPRHRHRLGFFGAPQHKDVPETFAL